MASRFVKKLLRPFTRTKPFEYPSVDPAIVEAWRAVKEDGLTYLSHPKIAALVRLVQESESAGREGVLIEAGCALGGSSIVLAHTKPTNQTLQVYDVFGMIPAPGDKDGADVHQRYETISNGQAHGINDQPYYGYEADLLAKVQQSFADLGVPHEENNVAFYKGLVQDTLQGTEPVVLAHIDVDWYDPVMTCLERIVPRLVVGGSIVLDDYHDWSGCRRATDEYFDDCSKPGFAFDGSQRSMVITRLAH
ncbi:MAG: TylF/MycF/NovP-related O-methyltransferase [Planctomycetota bacterium]|nr:TylF/MycF/NovP-related O-methyltransferase [Planctomycetota bacterium]